MNATLLIRSGASGRKTGSIPPILTCFNKRADKKEAQEAKGPGKAEKERDRELKASAGTAERY